MTRRGGRNRPAGSSAVGAGDVEVRLRRALRAAPDLLPRGASVIIAFSGGSDSLALLHLLCAVRGSRRLRLAAAHFDHRARPGGALRAARAADACQRVGVPCHVGRARAAGGSAGGQAAHRAARYAFLDDVRRRTRADRVALAHQRDDHVETVLLNLLRGCGFRGLAGIPPRRGPFVRPLLGFGREELRDYLRACGAEWTEDPGNRELRYRRARVRHGLLPALCAAESGDPRAGLAGLARHARAADGGLEGRVRRLLAGAGCRATADEARIARSAVLGYDRPTRGRLLRTLACDMGFRLSRRATLAGAVFMGEGTSGHGVDIARGLRIERDFERIRVRRRRPARPDVELEIGGEEPGHGGMWLGGCRFEVRWGALEGTERWATALPGAALRFPLRVRGLRPGDRIRTPAGARRLVKLLAERRVHASDRSCVPVVESADGKLLWVVGHATRPVASRDAEGTWFAIGVNKR